MMLLWMQPEQGPPQVGRRGRAASRPDRLGPADRPRLSARRRALPEASSCFDVAEEPPPPPAEAGDGPASRRRPARPGRRTRRAPPRRPNLQQHADRDHGSAARDPASGRRRRSRSRPAPGRGAPRPPGPRPCPVPGTGAGGIGTGLGSGRFGNGTGGGGGGGRGARARWLSGSIRGSDYPDSRLPGRVSAAPSICASPSRRAAGSATAR